MTADEVRRVLKTPYKPNALAALSYVNLSDRECNLLILRHMRGHTQEEVAEEMECSVNAVQKWERAALIKCGEAWKNILFVQEILAAQ